MRFAGILLVIAAVAAGCQLKDEQPPGPNDGPPPIPAPADVAAAPAEAIKTPSGLAYKVLTAGLGRVYPTRQSKVKVHYTGWTTDGRMFETSTRGEPAEFPVTDVVPGWTEMLQMMVKGQKVRVWIPARLAYEGMPERPQGMLVFEMELIEIR